jgi:hypothetical protein
MQTGRVVVTVKPNTYGIVYYLNTGNSTSPIFTQQVIEGGPFESIDIGEYSGSYDYPMRSTFVDLDGDTWFILSINSGPLLLHAYKLVGDVYVEQTGGDNPVSDVAVLRWAAPGFATQSDGSVVLAVGSSYGYIQFFTRAAGATTWVEHTNCLTNPFFYEGFGDQMHTHLVDLNMDALIDVVVWCVCVFVCVYVFVIYSCFPVNVTDVACFSQIVALHPTQSSRLMPWVRKIHFATSLRV